MFRKVTFLEIALRSTLSTEVAGLQPTVCNTGKDELLAKLFEGILELTENFQEVIFNEGHFWKSTGLQTTALSLACC